MRVCISSMFFLENSVDVDLELVKGEHGFVSAVGAGFIVCPYKAENLLVHFYHLNSQRVKHNP